MSISIDNSGDCENKSSMKTESDVDGEEKCCFRDAKLSWLENWTETKSSAVKTRLSFSRRRTKCNEVGLHSTTSGTKKKQTATVCNTSLSEFVESESQSKDTYYVQLHAPYGLGLSLFVSYDGIVTVEGLHYLANKQSSPAQLCGLIKVEDQLIQLNNINIEALDFYKTTNLLKDLDKYAKEDVITLGFRYGDIPPVLESNDNNSIASSTSEDSEEEEEGGEILLVTCQEQLLDSTINTDTVINRRRSGGNSSNNSTINMDTVINRRRSGGNSNSSTVYPKYTSLGSRESLSNHQNLENLMEKDSHTQRKSRRSSSSTYSTSSQYENSPKKAVINPEDRFLSLFTDQTANTDNDADGALLGGFLPNLSSWASYTGTTTTATASTTCAGIVQQQPQTSELAVYQQNIRKRHMYPVSLRSSCFASEKLPEQQLRELADEIFEWRPFQLSFTYAGFYSRPILPVTYKSDHTNIPIINQANTIEYKIKHLNEMKLSSLIATPIDTAQYNNTQHLIWDDRTQSYFPKHMSNNKQYNSYLDHQIAMKEVLLSLELAARKVCNTNSHNTLLKSHLQRQYYRTSPPKSSHWERERSSLEGFIVPDIGASRSRNNTSDADLIDTTANSISNTTTTNSNNNNNNNNKKYIKKEYEHNIISKENRHNNRLSSSTIALSEGIYIHTTTTTASHITSIVDPINHKSAVRSVPYTLPCFVKKDQVRYFRKSYEHIISVEHTAVQRVLHNQTYAQSLVLLQEAIDMEICNISNSNNDTNYCNSSSRENSSTSSDNPYHCAQHYHSNTEIFLPAMVLTYQLFYAIQHYRAVVLNSAVLLDCIEKWATTFNPIGILTVLNSSTTASTSSSINTTSSSNSYSDSNRKSSLYETNNKTQQKSGQKHSTKPEFLVFFNNDRQTVRNIHVFIEIISELLTFLVLGRIHSECLIIEQSEKMDKYSNNIKKVFNLQHLGIQIDYSYSNNATQLSKPTSDNNIINNSSNTSTSSGSSSCVLPGLISSLPDILIVGYIRKFQYLLQFDIIILTACIKQYTQTINNIIQILQKNELFTYLSKQIQDFVYKSQDSVLGFSQYYERIQYCYENIHTHTTNTTSTSRSTIITSYIGNKKQFSLLLCLVLSELRFLFITHTALALDVAVTMFPIIPPWYVSMILFGSSSNSGSSQYPDSVENITTPLIHAESTYYTYLTRLIRNQSDICSHDSELVLQWLGLALKLDRENHLGDDPSCLGGNFGLLSSPIHKRKSSYLVTVRTILYHPERYDLDLFSAVRVCGVYDCTEGVLLLSKRWMELIEITHLQPSARLIEQCLEATQLLQETTGRIISELVLLIYSSYSSAEASPVQQPAGSRVVTTIEINDTSSSSSSATMRLSQLCKVLSECVSILLKAYELLPVLDPAHTMCHTVCRDTPPIARLGRTFDTLVDAAIQALCPESEQLVDPVTPTITTTSATTILPWIQQIADICGDVLLQSLGVPRTLTLLQHAPILRTQLST